MSLTGQTLTQLTLSVSEKDVENGYRQYLTRNISDMVFTSPYKCDGFGVSETHKIRLLCEFKKDETFTKKTDQVEAIVQVIYYVKQFELSGVKLPNVILIGDKNNWFVLHVNQIFKYLSLELDWSAAASNAYKNRELFELLMNDEMINPFVFSVNQLDEVINKIKDLAKNIVRQISITPHNITEVFSYFENNVIGQHKLNTNDLANLFVQILINPDDNFLHTKKKVVYTKSFGEIPIKSKESFTSFFSHFADKYTPRQKEELTAVVDRLILDVTRRKQGEFFTPTIWANKAHEYIASVYGEDWKDKYVVWDPAWGTGNLTRDYKFKELYVSTLNYSDIQTAEQMRFNPEATKFQFDFLNDDYDFLPQGLRDAIEGGRDIIVLMNPPYGSVNDFQNIKLQGGRSKNNIEDTKVKKQMNNEQIGLCVKNLYTQFIYRITKMGNMNICLFSPPLMYSGIDFKIFRERVLNQYEFKGGFIMNSNQFDDVKSWGLTFSILSNKKDN